MGRHERPNKKARERYLIAKEIAGWLAILLSVASAIYTFIKG